METFTEINNWSICDCTSTTFNLKQPAEAAQMYAFLLSHSQNPLPYARRVVLVMLLAHYLQPQYLADILRLLDEVPGHDSYVNMAKAWLLAPVLCSFDICWLSLLCPLGQQKKKVPSFKTFIHTHTKQKPPLHQITKL